MKKLLSLVLTLVLLLSVMPLGAISAASNPAIVVDQVSGKAGDTVTVNVSLENNPGIISAKLLIGYDSDVLELTGKTAGAGFSGMAFSKDFTANPYFANWVDSINPNNTTNGAFVTLTFKIKDNAPSGVSPITVEYDPEDVYDENWDNVTFAVVNGSVDVEGAAVPTITVDEVSGKSGDTVTVNVNLENNPGIISAKLLIGYDSNVLELTGKTAGAGFSGMAFSKDFTANPYFANWVDSINPNNTTNGAFVTLTFKIKDTAASGVSPITVEYDPEDVYDENWDNVTFAVVNGSVTVAGCEHASTKTETQNSKDATCTQAGSYDTVTICNSCGAELSRVTTTIDALGHTEGTPVEENRKEAGCDTKGSYDVVIKCTVCGAEISRTTKTIDATGHKPGAPVQENRVEATCTQAGSYDTVVKCTVCGEETSRITNTIAATGHKPGEAVKENVVAGDCVTDATYDSVVYCTVCDEEIAKNTIIASKAPGHKYEDGACSACGAKDPSVTEDATIIVDQVEGDAGDTVTVNVSLKNNPGIISAKLLIGYDSNVLELTGKTAGAGFGGMAFSKDFTANPYFANWVDSINPNNTTNGAFVTLTFKIKDNAPSGVSPITVTYDPEDVYNEDWDNVEFTVVNGSVKVAGCEHVTTETKTENRVEPTCTTNGSYDEVTVCSDCGTEILRNTFTIAATGHTEGEAVEENRVEATCESEGSYDSVVYCSVCGVELSRKTVVIEKGNHLNAPAVEENRVEADCENAGSYESVVYCAVCGEEVSRKTITIPALGHTEGEVVIENKVDGDCLTDGSYDKVVYCTVCDKEISRETVVVEATGHKFVNGICEICGASNVNGATILVEKVEANKDETVDVKINLINNPGVISLKIEIDYDTNALELINATAGAAFSEMAYSEFITDVPFIANWINSLKPDNTASEFLTLTFRVKADAVPGVSPITVTYLQEDVFNSNWEDVTFEVENGSVTVLGCAHASTYEEIENVIDATCTTKGSYDKVTYCDECGAEVTRETVIVDALGHEITTVAAKEPTCTEDGWTAHIACTRCDYTSAYDVLPATGHTAGEAVEENRVEADCVNTGSYDLVVYCSVCGEELSRETVTIDALGHTEGEAVEENRVEADCENAGSYDVVIYCTVCGEELSRETVVIEALGHRLENVPGKKPTCTEDGWTAYQECARCDYESFHAILPALGHTAGEAVEENRVESDCVTAGSYESVVYCSVCGEELSRETVVIEALGHTEGEAVEENRVEADCVNKGSYELVVYCSVCGEELSRETVELDVVDHIPGEAVKENIQGESCTEPAAYDLVVYCSVCGEELSRETIEGQIPGHSEDEAVEENRVEADCENAGSYDVVIYCTVCGEELSRETVVIEALGHRLENVPAKKPTCTEEGWTAYQECARCDYESFHAIIPATGHTAGEAVEENRVEATCDAEGSYDVVVYCSVCGEELSRETVVIEALGHTAGEAVEENRVEADCVTEGSYDVVVYCSVCGEELSRETVVIDALGHTAGEAVEENRVEADCVTEGSYDAVVYCSVCGEELSRETVAIEALGHDLIAHDAKAPTCTEIGWDAYDTCSRCDYTTYVEIPATSHGAGEAVIENIVDPDCVNKGSYDIVIYCENCGVELSRKTVAIAALGHKLVDAFIENYVAPDCANKGSYDIAIYCLVCGKELARKTVEIQPVQHILVKHDAKAPTCTEIGWDAYESCLLCDYTTYTEKAALGHTYGPTTVVEPTFSAEGYSVHTCTVCGHEEKFDVVDALPYLIGDVNGDGKIDNKDLGLLSQYINTWDTDIILEAADVNGDGEINNKDAGILSQYINNWDVELG